MNSRNSKALLSTASIVLLTSIGLVGCGVNNVTNTTATTSASSASSVQSRTPKSDKTSQSHMKSTSAQPSKAHNTRTETTKVAVPTKSSKTTDHAKPATAHSTLNPLQILSDALTNTRNAVHAQYTEQIHEVVKPQPSASPQTIDMMIQTQIGMVGGQKAMLVKITTQSSGHPTDVQEYVQGARIWMNQGQGWREMHQSEALIQKIKSQLPGADVEPSALNDIKASSSGSGYSYRAQLTPAAMQNLLSPAIHLIAPQTGASVKAMLSHISGTVSINEQPVDAKPVVSKEHLQLSLNAPQSAQSSGASSSNIKIAENASVSYMYKDAQFKAPIGLS